jgi:hypothetical protein
MTEQAFEKTLTANDTGETGGHQAGIHIPKSQAELIRFLPTLPPETKNPDVWLSCIDEDGNEWPFRYVYYNNRLHDEKGTRDEYRITHMTKYFRAVGAKSGDKILIAGIPGQNNYRINISPGASEKNETNHEKQTVRVKLRGWRRVH